MMMKKFWITWLLGICTLSLDAQSATDSLAQQLYQYARAAQRFSQTLPQEKVSLHFDNTSYYQGDDIWFQCYVVTSGRNRPTPLSKTLYVELLNPGGETIATQILPIRNGRCHGNFSLKQLPFYAGFYEVRAYTKYMLNFGEDCIFSRILPVFEKPQTPGDYTQKEIRPYAVYKYPRIRKQPKKGKKLNLKFYPEGGYLVEGLPVRIAFEATDSWGNPVDITGKIVNREKDTLLAFASLHEGRGTFNYLPKAKAEAHAVVQWKNKTYRFDLPKVQPMGISFRVDNPTSTDSIGISLQKHQLMTDRMAGLAILCRGQLQYFYLLDLNDGSKPLHFQVSRRKLPAGVAQAVVFNADGHPLADRLFFTGRPDTVQIAAKTDKSSYQPYEPIHLEINLRDTSDNPLRTPLSVSVRDGEDEVEERHSLLTDLLLMSEIKGYVRHPAWYFESDDKLHRQALDQLLMVQGWRRYDWEQQAGIASFELKYPPEQGIEVQGKVVSMVRSKPKANMDITILMKRDTIESDSTQTLFNSLVTDSLGRFRLRTDITGRWNLVLSVTQNGKKKDHRILLDRVFSPVPRPYPLAEMQIEIEGVTGNELLAPDSLSAASKVVDSDQIIDAYEDSLRQAGMTEKIHRLHEVTVTAKKRNRAHDVYEARRKSTAYYDVASEIDDILDRNKFIGDDFNEMMVNMNPNFQIYREPHGRDLLLYNGRLALCVINYKRVYYNEMDLFKYQLLTLESIKSIYVTKDIHTMLEYADPKFTPFDIDQAFGCAVLIETYPEAEIPASAAKGVRKTRLEGYSQVKEFYQPDYLLLPPQPDDYRRTLYWNPEVVPGKDGYAHLRIYNNSRCTHPRITIETLTGNGEIGVWQQ